MPLLDPWQNLRDTGDYRHQLGQGRPLLLAKCVDRRECEAPLGLVPAGPTQQRGRVGGAAGAGVRNEPFLGDVELAAMDQYDDLWKSALVYFGGTGMSVALIRPASSSRWRSHTRSHSARFRRPDSL